MTLPRRQSIPSILMATLLLSLILPPSLFAADWNKRATPVVVGAVKKQYIAPTDWTVAEVISSHDSRIPAEVSAKILWLAREGTTIAKGKLLAELDNSNIKLQIKQTHATIKGHQARTLLLNKEVARLKKLNNASLASLSHLETVIKDRDVAMADNNGTEATLSLLQEELAKTHIHAPFDGLVMQRLKKPYEWAKQGDTLLRFIAPQRIEIRVFTPISHLASFNEGDSIDYRIRSTLQTGKINRIIAAGSSPSHQAELRISSSTDATAIKLMTGDILQVAIPTHPAKNAITVPRDALILRKNSARVYKIKPDGTAMSVSVVIGIGNHSDIEVSGNLQLGDQVVVRGGERLRPGQAVKILNAPRDTQEKPGKEHAWSEEKITHKP